MTGAVFMHGWGFSPLAWSGWAEAFRLRPVVLLDAGYFGPPMLTLPDNPDGWIGIGHSLGFARLLGMDVPWRGLVGIGGFLRFCSTAEHPLGTQPAIIDAMVARLDADPADVLARFLRRCGQRGQCPPPPEAEGLARLRQDLLFLRDVNQAPPQPPVPPCLLLHASDDRIVAPAMAFELRDSLRGSHLRILETGGHMLPFAHQAECIRLVKEHADAIG